MKKKIVIGILLVVLLLGGFGLFKGLTASEAKDVKKVKVQQVEAQKMLTTVDADGTVKSNHSRQVKTAVAGIVSEINIEEGEQLQSGEKLVDLKNDELEEEQELVALDLKEAQGQYQKLKARYSREQQRNNLKLVQAENKLQTAQQSLAKKRLELQSELKDLKYELTTAQDKLEQLKDELQTKKQLYQQQAIAEQSLKTEEENYYQQQQKVKRLQTKLEQLQEKKMPAELKLSRLKIKEARNQLQLDKVDGLAITKEEVKAAKLKITRSQTKLNNLEKKLQKLHVKAPIDGTVVNLAVKLGDKLTKNTVVAKLSNLDDLIVEAMVDEVDISQVEVGQEVSITSEAFAQEFSGSVTKIAPVATAEGNINKFKTEIKLNKPTPLRLGMFVTAEITTNKREKVIAVPQIAVFGDQNKYIYIIKDGQAEKKEVELGLKNLKKVQVKGIAADTKVIVGPFTTLKQLKSGMAVTYHQDKQK